MYKPKTRDDFLIQDVDGELLVLDRKYNEIHQLNTTASLIWTKCDGNNSIENIVKILINDFDISLEEATRDTSATIALFQEKNLLDS